MLNSFKRGISMDKVKIKLVFKDQDYSKALERALLLNCEHLDISNDNPDLILDDSSYAQYMPVQEIIKNTMAKMNCPLGLSHSPGETIYTGFTAGIGGGGLTSTALCYAKIKSRVFNQHVGFISFDPVFRQNFSSDSFNLEYLSKLPDVSDLDELVLDIPFGIEKYRDYLDMCERRVVITGFDEKRSFASEVLFDELLESSKGYINPPKTFLFENRFEASVDTGDIHSQLGKEVLEFARKLEEE